MPRPFNAPTLFSFFIKPVVFFLGFLLILTGIRCFFFTEFGSGTLTWDDFSPAFWMGLRIDARWLSMLMLPAWVLWLFGARFKACRTASVLLGLLGGGVMLLLGFVNVEFFRFYGTPISTVIFGLFQDDTNAIIATLVSDWPILQYSLFFLICTLLPLVLAWYPGVRYTPGGWIRFFSAAALLSVILGVMLRGSLSTFPLRYDNLAVSTHPFINQCVPNGAIGLYEAWKGQKALSFNDGPKGGLKKLGFPDINAVNKVLGAPESRSVSSAPAVKPHVVLAVMESMGRDEFEAHVPGRNNMLGRLSGELDDAWVFRNGLTIGRGTFPALEGILFDTPYTPLSQSRYGHKPFPFAKVMAFKNAGYKVVFLSAGSANWRGLNETLPLHGFDKVFGASDIMAAFPEAQTGTWGVGDEWMFKYARKLLAQSDAVKQPLLLVLLSTTNHPPHKVPDGRASLPVDPDLLPAVIVRDKTKDEFVQELRTYQYATDWLGWFIGDTRKSGLLSKTIIAATGDHNARFTYPAAGAWHHHLGVPVLFWVPEAVRPPLGDVDQNRWVTQRDIFPTLIGLSLGQTPAAEDGQNLARPTRKFTYGFFGIGKYGFSIGPAGIATVEEAGKTNCFRFSSDVLKPAVCTDTLRAQARFSAAQRAKVDWNIRSALLK